MKIFQDGITLFDIEKMLEKELTLCDNNIRIVSDINLTYEEYEYIKLKIQGLSIYRDDVDVWSQYRLCTLVCWVFALIYEDRDAGAQTIFNSFEGLPQYATRRLIEIYSEAFEEFGLEVPGVMINSVHSLYESIAVHAGVPDELHIKLYKALDSVSVAAEKEEKNTEKEFFKKLSPRMRFMLRHVGNDIQRNMIYQYKNVLEDIKVNGMSKEQVLDRYPLVSTRIVNSFDEFYKCEGKEVIAV